MTVGTIARDREEVVTATPDTAVFDVAQLMEANKVGSVVIEDGGEIAGIVTDRDLALTVIGEQRQFEALTAADVMTEDVFAVSGDRELFDLFSEMGEHNVRRIPVVEDGELAGIVTLDDLLAVLHSEMGNITEVVRSESPPHPKL